MEEDAVPFQPLHPLLVVVEDLLPFQREVVEQIQPPELWGHHPVPLRVGEDGSVPVVVAAGLGEVLRVAFRGEVERFDHYHHRRQRCGIGVLLDCCSQGSRSLFF